MESNPGDGNVMEKMLQKGDDLRPRYDNFDFDKLDSQQLFWLKRLSLFSAYRKNIENRFKEVRVSTEMKVLFVEQHSMKLRQDVFYDIEAKR